MRKFADSRELLLFCLGGVVIVGGGAYLGELQSTSFNWLRVASIVIVGIGGSIVASAFVGLGLRYYEDTGCRKKRKMLSQLLGVDNIGGKVAIVLPRFSKPDCEAEISVNSVKEEVKRNQYTIKDNRLTNRYSLAFDDIAAARHISSIFIELRLPPPRIEFDDDAWDSLFNPPSDNDKLREYSSFICIGLFSHYVTMEIANRRDIDTQRLFKISDKEAFYAGERKVAICPDHLSAHAWNSNEEIRWDLTVSANLLTNPKKLERQPDFALIAKCKAPDGRTCLIVGGAKSRATRKAASFIRKNWQAIYNHPDTCGKINVTEKAFAAIYDLAGERDSMLRERGFRIAT